MHILVITDQQTAPSVQFYRSAGVIGLLPKIDPAIKVSYMPIQEAMSRDNWAWGQYDVIVPERYYTEQGAQIISIALSYGRKVWIDDDDHRFAVPQSHDAANYYAHPSTKQRIQYALSSAHLVTVSTPTLQKAYSGMAANIHVIPNAFNDYVHSMADTKAAGKPVQMSWRGTDKHAADLEAVRQPLAKAFLNQHLRWKFYGAHPRYLATTPDQRLPFMPLFQYFAHFCASGTDFLFVPLENNELNKAKSAISVYEAAQAGAVAIAPMYLPEFNIPGVIRYKDNSELPGIFEKVAKGAYDKPGLVKEAQEWVLNNRALSEVNKDRAQLVMSLSVKMQ